MGDGSYTCACNEGFTGDGLTCIEITTTTVVTDTTVEITTEEPSVLPGFFIVKADARENVTDEVARDRIKLQSLDKLVVCLEDTPRRDLIFEDLTVTLHPKEDSDKK